MNLVDLNEEIRDRMAEEIAGDLKEQTPEFSTRLTTDGRIRFSELLLEAVSLHDDHWLANRLNQLGLIKRTESRRKRSGGFSQVKVPHTAATTLAQDVFNRYYVRALCKFAIENEIEEVEVYRAKRVTTPRSSSRSLIGRRFNAAELLDHVLNSGLNAIIPQGPNSGLSVRLVFSEPEPTDLTLDKNNSTTRKVNDVEQQ